MNRKLVILLAVILFSTGVMLFARGYQKSYIASNGTVVNSGTKVLDNTNSTEQKNQAQSGDGQVKDQAKAVENKTAAPEKNSNINQEKTVTNVLIIDSIGGRNILSFAADVENKTVAQVTIEALNKKNIRYKTLGSGANTYFSMIDNLKERDFGPESGWCYFVNGKKYSVGAGSYRLNKNDILEWKYLKEGITP